MDGEIGAALRHRHFEFFDEQTFATDIGQRPVLHAVAFSRHPGQPHLAGRIQRREPRPDVLGLPHRERRLPRRDDKPARRLEARGDFAHLDLT
jgi:hypothetical protein